MRFNEPFTINKALRQLSQYTGLWSAGGDIGRDNGFLVKHDSGTFRIWVDAWIWECLDDVCPANDAEAFKIAVERAKGTATSWNQERGQRTGVWIYDEYTKPFAVTWEIYPIEDPSIVKQLEENLDPEDIIEL